MVISGLWFVIPLLLPVPALSMRRREPLLWMPAPAHLSDAASRDGHSALRRASASDSAYRHFLLWSLADGDLDSHAPTALQAQALSMGEMRPVALTDACVLVILPDERTLGPAYVKRRSSLYLMIGDIKQEFKPHLNQYSPRDFVFTMSGKTLMPHESITVQTDPSSPLTCSIVVRERAPRKVIYMRAGRTGRDEDVVSRRVTPQTFKLWEENNKVLVRERDMEPITDWNDLVDTEIYDLAECDKPNELAIG
ncbi:unnamed protein product [Vitrella brassicaformis CCMP3155]|uniref:Uncharacterized protein n=2 Tax=Vitrella brassicaformis TaxID=1169539 RepID=A0A0G4ECL6_VITBC|nr:unnamed protein product [Vitrella brassicaformis CCMP3155]|eukprot:CEL93045.1 unnamed protein product [Vitrella brassicaformis CCMP3155]